MNTKQKTNWLIDTVLFAAFILTFFLDLTGVTLHQIIGLGAGILAGYHLLAHRQWLWSVTQRFFGKTSDQARLYYLIDAAILGGFFTILVTGVGISTWLDLSLANDDTWWFVHISASTITLATICIKLALHWRWIASVGMRILSQTNDPQIGRVVMRPAVQAQPVSRRSFLKIMSIVGGVSLLAVTQPLKSLQLTGTAESETTTASNTRQTTTNQSSAPIRTGTCGKRCSYPGHCRRYTDSNGNNRCDLGESA